MREKNPETDEEVEEVEDVNPAPATEDVELGDDEEAISETEVSNNNNK